MENECYILTWDEFLHDLMNDFEGRKRPFNSDNLEAHLHAWGVVRTDYIIAFHNQNEYLPRIQLKNDFDPRIQRIQLKNDFEQNCDNLGLSLIWFIAYSAIHKKNLFGTNDPKIEEKLFIIKLCLP